MTRNERIATFRRLLTERILVIDGAMGTMIQNRKLTEADYRGERFKDWKCDLKGNSDVLVLTSPQVIGDIHRARGLGRIVLIIVDGPRQPVRHRDDRLVDP